MSPTETDTIVSLHNPHSCQGHVNQTFWQNLTPRIYYSATAEFPKWSCLDIIFLGVGSHHILAGHQRCCGGWGSLQWWRESTPCRLRGPFLPLQCPFLPGRSPGLKRDSRNESSLDWTSGLHFNFLVGRQKCQYVLKRSEGWSGKSHSPGVENVPCKAGAPRLSPRHLQLNGFQPKASIYLHCGSAWISASKTLKCFLLASNETLQFPSVRVCISLALQCCVRPLTAGGRKSAMLSAWLPWETPHVGMLLFNSMVGIGQLSSASSLSSTMPSLDGSWRSYDLAFKDRPWFPPPVSFFGVPSPEKPTLPRIHYPFGGF